MGERIIVDNYSGFTKNNNKSKGGSTNFGTRNKISEK